MADLKFEGEYQILSESQLNLVINVLEKRGFTNETVSIKSVGKTGDNYIANVKRIIAKRNDGQSFNMIAKIAPTMEAIRKLMNTVLLFMNEIVMYSEILPKFAEILDSENLPKDQLYRTPACYGYLSDAPNEIILLEDLHLSRFEILDRQKPLSNECIKLALYDLGILHSLSYVMQNRHPEIMKCYKQRLLNLWSVLCSFEEMRTSLQQLDTDLISLLDKEKHKKAFDDTIANFTNKVGLQHNDALKSNHSVILHGDCWTNNIMFRLEDGKVVESCFIDYQVSKAGSPAEDILYLILNCTDHETRSENYGDWIDYYYAQLDKSLRNFGLNANRVYPRDQLDADLKTHGRLSLALSTILTNVICRESEEAMDINESSGENNNKFIEELNDSLRISAMKEGTRQRFKKIIEGHIESLLEFELM